MSESIDTPPPERHLQPVPSVTETEQIEASMRSPAYLLRAPYTFDEGLRTSVDKVLEHDLTPHQVNGFPDSVLPLVVLRYAFQVSKVIPDLDAALEDSTKDPSRAQKQEAKAIEELMRAAVAAYEEGPHDEMLDDIFAVLESHSDAGPAQALSYIQERSNTILEPHIRVARRTYGTMLLLTEEQP